MNIWIRSTIDALNRYGFNNHHVNLPMAVNEAETILENLIQQAERNEPAMRNIWKCARDSLDFWTNVSKILAEQMVEMDHMKYNISNIKYRVSDITDRAHQTQSTLDKAMTIHTANIRNFNLVVDQENLVRKLKNEIFILFNNSVLAQGDELLVEIEDGHDKLRKDLTEIIELKDIVNENNDELEDGFDTVRDNWLTKAKVHSDELAVRARKYANSFLNTKNGAEVALRAR